MQTLVKSINKFLLSLSRIITGVLGFGFGLYGVLHIYSWSKNLVVMFALSVINIVLMQYLNKKIKVLTTNLENRKEALIIYIYYLLIGLLLPFILIPSGGVIIILLRYITNF
jgi:hypothetical protein